MNVCFIFLFITLEFGFPTQLFSLSVIKKGSSIMIQSIDTNLNSSTMDSVIHNKKTRHYLLLRLQRIYNIMF